MSREDPPIDKDSFREIVENVLKISSTEELVEIARVMGIELSTSSIAGCDNMDTVVPSTEEERTKAMRDQYADATLGDTSETLCGIMSSESQYIETSKFVPLRLEYNERRYLRLLESTIDSSDYTDRVDGVGLALNGQTHHRLVALILKNICSLLSGLVIAHDSSSTAVSSVLEQRDFAKHQAFFRKIFEIGRRYKILNPERMRESYFKMMYFMQDLNKSEIADLFDPCFNIVAPVDTVHSLLTRSGPDGLALLRDPWIETATCEILSRGKTKSKVQEEIRAKETAIKRLVTKYSNSGPLCRPRFNRTRFYQQEESSDSAETPSSLTRDNVERCLYSLCDFNTFLRFNQGPCERMIELLQKHFTNATPVDVSASLAIVEGEDGARLSHSHSRQYTFVIQSLTFWSEVMQHMLQLWHAAEADLLDPSNPYIRTQTGQGLQRVQKAPRVYSLMTEILKKIQHRLGGWVGSSTIHLGDENVPNALIFIDKYMQVPKILQPIVLCIDKVEEVSREDTTGLAGIITAMGGTDSVERRILRDFFRHGFDGSGADNFFDAGSCVDGRLTSAWNWCSKIEQKDFYPVFQLTGFVGFDSSGNR